MKVKGLDGRIHSWNLSGYQPLLSEQGGSSGHCLARKIISKLYPVDRILEEVHLPGSNGLRADFFLPNRLIIVEIHGRQHYEFVAHFHVSRLGFMKHMERDRKKVEWCEINGISYVELPYNKEEEWEKLILNAKV